MTTTDDEAYPQPSVQIRQIVGLDFGHGETAASCMDAGDGQGAESAQFGEHGAALVPPKIVELVVGRRSFETAMARDPDSGETLIGRDALTTEGATEVLAAFKGRPIGNESRREAMKAYVRALHARFRRMGDFPDDQTMYYVGCPTDWTSARASDNGQTSATFVVDAYVALLREAGFKYVKVISESRAALFEASKSAGKHEKMSDLQGLALVVNCGSSTTDITVVNLDRQSTPSDVGADLGGTLIDRLILLRVLSRHPAKERMQRLLREDRTSRAHCEIACRAAKEAWFSGTPEQQLSPKRIVGQFGCDVDDLTFRPRLDRQEIEAVLAQELGTLLRDGSAVWPENESSSVLERQYADLTWPAAFRTLMESARAKAQGAIAHVFLTGGASRMGFILEVARQLFPDARIIVGREPEVAVAIGLAYAGRQDLRYQRFITAVQNQLDVQLTPAAEGAADSSSPLIDKCLKDLWAKLSGVLADRAVETVVRPQFVAWRSTESSVESLSRSIGKELQSFGQDAKTKNRQVMALKAFIVETAGAFNKDCLAGIAKAYGLPDHQEALFSEEEFLKEIEVNTPRLNGDAIDQRSMAAAIDTAIEEVTGIIGVAIFGIVAAVLLSTHVVGFIVAAVGGLLVAFVGKDKVKEVVATYALKPWMKNRLNMDDLIAKTRASIAVEIQTKLEADQALRKRMAGVVKDVIEVTILRNAERARVWIH